MSLADLRREYNLAGLRRGDLEPEPLAQFRKWFDQARGARSGGRVRRFCVRLYKALLQLGGSEVVDVNAMTLATVDKDGRPSARVVLLKGVDDCGFVFFTNYRSRKGKELAENPEAALVFYWPDLERQVCVAGEVRQLPPAESDVYFKSRPRGSRIAAWASNQSEAVAGRAALQEKWEEFETRYPGADVPRPPHWGGYVLIPSRIEFWQGRPNRLHDRFCYTRQEDKGWAIERLCP
ncbi:MAG TPA: pyridoxamine 5'-phosphate oxidase [Candidatus Binatia bacterium]|jgi:pyridoxamine 5'-phosphate oxidase|nr:pyridoxamine 5'-phosphate oxidase [Candidatus Binatia bacterium]